MDSINDPRMEFYFTMLGDTIYKGAEYGAAGNKYKNFSHVAATIQLPNFEGTIFDYAEVEFYLAEAARRGYDVGGTAEEHYNAGITASINYWAGVNGIVVPDSVITEYLANPIVAWDNVNWEKCIGYQKWIAYYNRGFEAWTSWRKLGYPKLVAPPTALTEIPLRFTYPIEEQTLNGANYQAASGAIGGDLVTTKLFFFKHTNF
jgi:hypothetical protein